MKNLSGGSNRQSTGWPRGGVGVSTSSQTISPDTDMANAQRLIAQHGDDLRFCYDWAKWLVWTGIRWKVDNTGALFRRAKETVASIYSEGLHEWARKSESLVRIKAMISLAESEVAVTPGELDVDGWLLNVRNGTINLRTGELRPHNRDDLITIVAPVEFDSAAPCHLWEAFLTRIFRRDPSLARYVQRSLGYALTGDVREQVIFFLCGPGANGKTTLQNVMLGILGDYAKSSAPGLLLHSNHDRHPTEIADLKGARFVASAEIGEGKTLREELVKRLTGSDRLKGRFMRQDFWEFDPTHKIFVACNHMPNVRGADHAIWRRMKVIPFAVHIPEKEQDKELTAKLLAERSGILNWLIDGAQRWDRRGLREPKAIRTVTEEYRLGEDVLGQFLADCCVQGLRLNVKKGELYGAYCDWCRGHGEDTFSQRELSKRLQERGFRGKKSGAKSEHHWFGLTLRDNGDIG